jgi:hypothetical protein
MAKVASGLLSRVTLLPASVTMTKGVPSPDELVALFLPLGQKPATTKCSVENLEVIKCVGQALDQNCPLQKVVNEDRRGRVVDIF